MFTMEYDIRIGDYRIGALDSVTIKKSVESLADTAVIVLPAMYINKTLDVESRLKEGNEAEIAIGYGNDLVTEFKGWLKDISTDDNKITLELEDDIYLFRKEVSDKEYKNITVKGLLSAIAKETDSTFTIECDYDFTYDKYVVKDATGYDVLKKVQDETKANIYLKDSVLHVHPQYSEIANDEAVVYDFSVNVEKSDLKWKSADERKYFIEVEGVKPDGSRITATAGKQGGDKRSIKVYGVSDVESLKKRAQEELSLVVYTGFEGSITGWLVPFCEPAYKIKITDKDYPDKTGVYYVVSTETKFSRQGGERHITIGKKIG